MSRIVPLHYATHAAAHFADIAPRMRNAMPGYDHVEDLLVRWLQRAVVFQLPDNGVLFSERDFRPELLDLIRLPYPMIAIEFHADATLYREESGLERADKRITLAFTPYLLPPEEKALLRRAVNDEDWLDGDPAAIALLALYAPNTPPSPYMAWGFAAGFAVWEPSSDLPIPTDMLAEPELPEWMKPRRRSEHSLPVSLLPFHRRMAMLGVSKQDGLNSILNDSTDEIGALWDLLSALNCKNVVVQAEPAPAALNKKREKSGKPAFKDTHFLDIAVNSGDADGRSGTGGGHASPRVHLRRGHIRHLPATETRPARNLWINATSVGGKGELRARPYRLRAATPA